MKGDIVLKIIASLLIPLLMLAGFLVLNDYKIFGFSTFIGTIISFASAYLLYYIKYGKIKTSQLMVFKFLTFGTIIIFTGFLFYIMFKLINFL